MLATLIVYAPLFHASFINFDDPDYVLKNPHVKEGFTAGAMAWAWTTTAQGNWHPLTWMSHTLDWSLFGAGAGGHHAASVLLHAANAVLLFLVLASASGATRRAWTVAALFALHPLHVESVAWISERKDVLSTVFGLAAMLAYVGYARRPTALRMAAVTSFLAAGLCAKPMLVTLPFLLLLLDAWPLGRWALERPTWRSLRPLVVEKAPLFGVAFASCVVTVVAQRAAGATAMNVRLGLPWRIGNAAVSYAAYLAKAVVPNHLAIFYTHPRTALSIPLAAGCAAGLAAITLAAVRSRGRRPYLLVGWLWYVGMLVPVIGLVQVGSQARADRYTYLPLVGVFLAAAWGCADLLDALARRRRADTPPTPDAWNRLAPLLAVLPPLAVGAWAQARTWEDSISVWSHQIAMFGPNPAALAMLGNGLAEAKRLDEAEEKLRQSLRLDPNEADAANGLGAVLIARRNPAEAVPLLERALSVRPSFAEAHVNEAAALDAMGRDTEALSHALAAVSIDPASVDGHRSAGLLLTRAGHPQDAIPHLVEASRLDPARIETQNDLGMALVAAGRTEEGIAHYRMALAARADYPEALNNLGGALILLGRLDEADANIRRALALVPNYGKAHSNLAAVRFMAGRDAEAWDEIRRARAGGFDPPPQLVDALRSRTPEP